MRIAGVENRSGEKLNAAHSQKAAISSTAFHDGSDDALGIVLKCQNMVIKASPGTRSNGFTDLGGRIGEAVVSRSSRRSFDPVGCDESFGRIASGNNLGQVRDLAIQSWDEFGDDRGQFRLFDRKFRVDRCVIPLRFESVSRRKETT